MSINVALAESVAPLSVAFERVELVGLSREEIARALVDADIGVVEGKNANMRATQIWRWIYVQGVNGEDAFASMTNLSIPLRAALERRFSVTRAKIATQQVSVDGTCKWLLEMGDGALVECVYIPEESRGTLCISSQVGCTLNCRFCHTGTQRLARNLTAPEIVGQILVARDYLGEWPTPTFERRFSNIVLMGMGEPLYNFDAVKNAVNIATDGEGLGISKRRVTLSTAGVAPLIPKAGEEIGTSLAISLHATNNKLRDELVPINKKYPIKMLLDACRNYPGLSNARRITFEYVLLDGVNDSPGDAKELLRLLKNIPSKINLIPFNPWPGAPYKRSSDSAIGRFAAILQKAGYASPVRTPRGEDIMAACGQLKSTTLPIRRSQQ
ncbi:MAG: 23S rRNA (adenine(2503)-C(2))-methyltransferase RlmN [Hyphomicrobiales bacterium]|nr:23S rRNA (adenine(2503)-C(2))-methyltransferase RlmN [Hyphomicrobiales bacterium]